MVILRCLIVVFIAFSWCVIAVMFVWLVVVVCVVGVRIVGVVLWLLSWSRWSGLYICVNLVWWCAVHYVAVFCCALGVLVCTWC